MRPTGKTEPATRALKPGPQGFFQSRTADGTESGANRDKQTRHETSYQKIGSAQICLIHSGIACQFNNFNRFVGHLLLPVQYDISVVPDIPTETIRIL